MKMRPEVKPALWGVVGGAIAIVIIGFSWGGWKTGASAREMVTTASNKAVVVALTPFCVEKFNAAPDAAAQLAVLKKANTWERQAIVEKGGYAVSPGGEKPAEGVAQSCASALNDIPGTAASN